MSRPVLTRREFLKTAGNAGLALTASQLGSLFVVAGDRAAEGLPVKVGILHSLTGIMAKMETALKDGELMAIDEINRKGGVLHRKIEATIVDPGSNFANGFPEKASKLLREEKVTAVFGCWTSASRKSVLPVFEQNNGLLFYPVPYEGRESSKNIIYTGTTPSQQAIPAVDWLRSEAGGGKKRFYLLGSDYIYPRTVNLLITRYLQSKGLQPVAEKYTPLQHQDYTAIVKDIKAQKPDVILNTLVSLSVGGSNLSFYNELAANGITAATLPVCSLLDEEVCIRGIDPDKIQGHLIAASYFQNMATPKNKGFVKRFQDKYGKDRIITAAMEAAYFQVYLWKEAVEKAHATDVDKVRDAIGGLELAAPEGKVKVDERNHHTWKQLRIARIAKDGQLEVVSESKEWIAPDPFPAW